MELNANSRESVGGGGILSVGLELNDQFDAGLKAGFSLGVGSLTALEMQGFFRYTFPFQPFDNANIFIQAELGSVLFFYEGETYPAFLGGVAAGLRFFPGEKWYLEPALRLGYPFMWGVGLTAGINFDLNRGGHNEN